MGHNRAFLNVTRFAVFFVCDRLIELLRDIPEAIQATGDMHIGGKCIPAPKLLGRVTTVAKAIEIASAANGDGGKIQIVEAYFYCSECDTEHPGQYIGEPYCQIDSGLAIGSFIDGDCPHGGESKASVVYHQRYTYRPEPVAEPAQP